MKPLPQQVAASAMALRGPARSTQRPPNAADRPSMPMAMLKMIPMAVSPVPK